MKAEVTIVTACDRNYLWGAFLLAASAAKNIPDVPFHLLQAGFTEEDVALFTQFPQVRVFELSDEDRRNVSNRKSEAILSADTEYIAWLDADCMVIGDISSMLIPANGDFQIRLREPDENAWVWCEHYQNGDTKGSLPAAVIEKWREDVGQRETPRLDTTCVANTFVIHRRHLDFIRQWRAQIAKVLPSSDNGLIDRRSPAYFMIDESVLSSLVMFSDLTPPIGPLQLNRDPKAHVAHFGSSPKPWTRWRKQFWYCHRPVMELMEWLRANGKDAPVLPWAFKPSSTPFAWSLAHAEAAYAKCRGIAGGILRKSA
ncbi:MAG: hypothetical protein KDN05_03775 [Verrucomicrobiae bacterium]|nr:hypothetical protein [Verrucomicrobiae bacterium]